MASEFPGRPKLLKGAIVAFSSQLIAGIPRVVMFQYNPDTLTRTFDLRPPAGPRQAGRARRARETLQVAGPPTESIRMKVMLDAADQLEPGQNPDMVLTGLHPALATLELLLYPPSSRCWPTSCGRRWARARSRPPTCPWRCWSGGRPGWCRCG